MTRMWWFVVSLVAGLLAGAPVNAADTVKVGVIYPLTGNAASAGQSAKDAVELGAEIVNNAYPELKNLLTEARTIAMIGASSNPDKASYGIMQQLQKRGYHVIPINPRETEVLGERAYASLADVKEPIDIVDVFRRAEDTPAIADEAVKVGAKALWLQTGIVSDDAAARAEAGGLLAVMDACIAATHALLQVPPKAR